MSEIQVFISNIVDNVEKVIVGKRSAIEMLMVAMLCEGHVLLEDVPGVGKTMLARSLAISLGGHSNRIQCTPRSSSKRRYRGVCFQPADG